MDTTSNSSKIAPTGRKTRAKKATGNGKGSDQARSALILKPTSSVILPVPLGSDNAAKLRAIHAVMKENSKYFKGIEWEYLLEESIAKALERLDNELNRFLEAQGSATKLFTDECK